MEPLQIIGAMVTWISISVAIDAKGIMLYRIFAAALFAIGCYLMIGSR